MVEERVVKELISQDFGGLGNSVRRLVGTDTCGGAIDEYAI